MQVYWKLDSNWLQYINIRYATFTGPKWGSKGNDPLINQRNDRVSSVGCPQCCKFYANVLFNKGVEIRMTVLWTWKGMSALQEMHAVVMEQELPTRSRWEALKS